MKKESPQSIEFIVALPQSLSISGYSELPKVGVTIASSYRDAVGHYIFRHLPRTGALVLSHLDKQHGDFGKFAYATPVIDRTGLDYFETQEFLRIALAGEIAQARKERPSPDHLKQANYLLGVRSELKAHQRLERIRNGASLL